MRRAGGVAVLVCAAAVWGVAIHFLWRSVVPAHLPLSHLDARRYFGAALLRRTASYDRFVSIDFVLSQAALVLALVGYAARGARLVRESAAGRIGTGMLLGMLGFAVVWLAQLPFGLAGLWWERRHGVSSDPYLTWILSSFLTLGGVFLFVCLAILIVMGVAGLLRDRWWLVGGPAFVGLAVLFAFVQPYLTPDVHPLRNQALAAEARQLERAELVPPTPIEVQNVRKFTDMPNAEAMGLGPSRRVVLWDTLLDGRFSAGEVRVVLAHELGHLARNHIWKALAWYALFALPGAYVIAVVTRRRGGMYAAEAVPLSLLALVVLQLLALPAQNAISRRREAEADWMALRTTRDPASARALFRAFAATAREEPDPPTWQYVLLEDHPTLAQRIAMANAWQARYATSAAQSP